MEEIKPPQQGPTMYFINDLISNFIKWQEAKSRVFFYSSDSKDYRLDRAQDSGYLWGSTDWMKAWGWFLGGASDVVFLDLDAGFLSMFTS